MFKTVFGRKNYIDIPVIDSNNNTSEDECPMIEPTINYDSYFIDENLKFDCKFEQYYPSMVSKAKEAFNKHLMIIFMKIGLYLRYETKWLSK